MKYFPHRYLRYLLLICASAAALQAQTGAVQCTAAVAAASPNLRADGLAELLPDYLLTCTGGVPTGLRVTVPQINLTISANAAITSRLLAPGWSEALLLVDDPSPASQLACATTNGVCAIAGTRTGTDTYNGTTGRPNIFQGQPTQANQVTFAIPFDPPGTATRRLRITNLRVNALSAPASVVLSAVSSGPVTLNISNAAQTVAIVQPAGSLQLAEVIGGANGLSQFKLRLTERFAAALKTRSSAAYSSSESSPAPVNQNVPGQILPGSETGFYNSTLPNTPGRGNLGVAGLASNGTRVVVTLGGIHDGVRVTTSLTVNLTQGGTTTGVLRLINADDSGAGQFATFGTPVFPPDEAGIVRIAFEVMNTSPVRIETADIPFFFSGTAAVPSVSITVGLAPLSTVPAADASAPLPRFNNTVTLSAVPLYFTPASLTQGAPGASYSVQFAASGGTAPYTWSAKDLPAGLTLSPSGLLSGTLGAAGSYPFTITATDAAQSSSTLNYTLVVSSQLQISTASLPNGSAGILYSQTITAAGGTPPYTFSALATGGPLPAGLALNPNGTLSGTPTTPATYQFIVGVNDARNAQASKAFSLTITAPLQITTPSPLPAGAAGAFYTASFTASGGTAPYTFSIMGSPPPGLTMSAAGNLTGTPTASGTFNFTVQVSDSAKVTVSKLFQITFGGSAPLLLIPKTQLDFTAVIDGDDPPPQGAPVLSSSGNTVDFAIVVDGGAPNTPAPAWLWIKLSAGVTPAALLVGVDQEGLAAGSYKARIRFGIARNPSVAPIDLAVNLTVVSKPQQLDVIPDILRLRSRASVPQQLEQAIVVRNSGGGAPIAFTASSVNKSGWITDITPSSGKTARNGPALVRVQINTQGLSAGSYRDVIRFTWGGTSVDVPVTVFVSDPGPVLALNVTGHRFQVRQGAGSSKPQNVNILNLGGPGSVVNWTAEVVSGAEWLSIGDTTRGTATPDQPGTITLTCRPGAANLAIGGAYSLVRVSDAAALNSPQYLVVVADVVPASTPAAPEPSAGGVFLVVPKGSPPRTATPTIYTSSATAQPYQASVVSYEGGGWLTSTTGGETSTGTPGRVTVTLNPANLALGIHKGQLNVSMNGAVRTKDITLIVTPADSPAPPDSQAAAIRPAAACAPSRLAITQAGLTDSFTVPAGWPATLIVQLFDDCGQPVNNGSVVASFSNADPPLTLVGDRTTGTYSATWQPGIVSSETTVTIRAGAGALPQVTQQLTGAVNANVAPVLAKGGTLHNLNPVIGGALAPGTIVQVFGTGLAGSDASVPATPLPTTFNGTTMLVGSLEAPIFFVSSGQINVQIPNELAPNRQYPVIISANGALTLPDLIDVVPLQPGVLQNPDGGLIAQHSADFKLVDAANPARPDEFLIMYLAGMGATSPVVKSGTPAPSGPFAEVAEKPVVTVDGTPAEVGFAGMTPGGVGLFQINFKVPPGARTGTLEVVVKQGNTSANVTRLPVAR